MAMFYPQAKAIPVSNGWRPTYVLFEGKREQCIPGETTYPTEQEAKAAAKKFIIEVINPPVESEQIAVEQELSEVEQWREKKRRDAEAERRKLFGDPVVKNKSGRVVEVVRR